MNSKPLTFPDALAIYNEIYSAVNLYDGNISFPYADECLLAGLYRQALFGDCIRTRPSRRDIHDFHKHEIWRTLQDISQEEATALFIQELERVKTYLQKMLEEIEPNPPQSIAS